MDSGPQAISHGTVCCSHTGGRDGDGFANFSRLKAGQRSAEIIRDRILKKYPFPVTVSIIEAELRGLIRTQRLEDAEPLQALAREIFALPNVEIASHS